MSNDSRHARILKYFYLITALVALAIMAFILADIVKSRTVRDSLSTNMDNLRDLIFMSTYDSLKKGNMKLFKNHLEEIGTLEDVREFSLLDTKGVIRYSSNLELVKQSDGNVIGLNREHVMISGNDTTYYFPVETTSYCSRCHPDWVAGTVNSYYKLMLSRKALDAVEQSTFYYYAFIVLGGGLFLGVIYLLFTLYERKKHEEQMLLSASVFENAVEAIAITTFDSTVEKINPAFTRITGFTGGEILGRDIHVIDAGDVNWNVYQEMREQIRAKGQWSGEIWNRRKNGEVFPAHLSVTAVRNVQKRITHFISIFYDVSSERAAERALAQMDRMKSEFISMAAHELRTPLAAIMGFTELIRHPQQFGTFSQEQTDEFLDEIYDRGEALEKIISDLLDISRIESGKPIELDLQEFPLEMIFGKAVEFFRAHYASHTFLLDLPEGARELTLRADRYRINQVLENLLSNAAKYSPKGRQVTLRCQALPGEWTVSVIDQGIGMTPEQVERIFDKFYRADSSDSAVSGLGLGMSIARQIVETHGGRIWVNSVKEEGTSITFTLPRD